MLNYDVKHIYYTVIFLELDISWSLSAEICYIYSLAFSKNAKIKMYQEYDTEATHKQTPSIVF